MLNIAAIDSRDAPNNVDVDLVGEFRLIKYLLMQVNGGEYWLRRRYEMLWRLEREQ